MRMNNVMTLRRGARNVLRTQNVRCMSSEASNVLAASIVERLPIVTPEPEAWEQAFIDMKFERDMVSAIHMPKNFYQERSTDAEDRERFEADPDDLGNGFTVAPRVTEDDEQDNRQSLNRALSERLFLLVQPQNVQEGDEEWWFPQGKHVFKEERMKETALRNLGESVGGDLEVTPVGNAPVGHLTRTSDNLPMFFYKAQYYKGDIDMNTDVVKDYVWVTKDEMQEYLSSSAYDYVKQILP